ncbi:type II/IV secretion system ATPase subunit [Candidatus Pacearchaeota archaeon]|nr:type II/IV secretion system ATPase subunit [Candidatus Pacearchaeota archaeon]
MLFKPGTKLYSYEIVKEAGASVMYINYMGALSVPSLSENPDVMARTIDLLIESPNTSRIVYVSQRNYSYDSGQVFLLQEISNLYIYLTKHERILSPVKLSITGSKYLPERYNDVGGLLMDLKRDPILCYINLNRVIRKERINLENTPEKLRLDQSSYLRLLERFLEMIEKLSLIKSVKGDLVNYSSGKRNIYYKIFRPDIIPNFTFTRLVLSLPKNSEILQQYRIGRDYEESVVTILKRKEDAKSVYHLSPPEFSLDEDKQDLLNLARNVLIEHQPKAEEFTDPEKTRQVFFNVSRDLLRDLCESKKIKIDYEELNTLSYILVRHTIGFGLIEVLLQDKNIQDIVINAPSSSNPIFLRHQKFDECITNIIPSLEDVDSWAAKLRMISGRPLDEANPVLDSDLGLGSIKARVAVIQPPLSPDGLSYAIRRHREDPWTLPLFIKNKMMNSFTAGLLSFLIDGSRTLLIAGTRSSGKTSLLGSLMLEIMPKYRIIVVEDTSELPVGALARLKYDILRMKVRSSLLKTSAEVSADEGIRTSLRLGDSSLIVGEVRSLEAKALYEAMRVGALANVVAGTIHGASPYAVFDRVVNDLEVPVTSFKATDVILVANPIKTPDGLSSIKRVLQLAEVRKHWTSDPETEGGFVDLLKYDVEKDDLIATDELINGDSEVIKSIAANIKGWAGDWEAVYDNILLRAKVKKEIVDMSIKHKIPDILEAKFNSLSNNMFHEFSREVQEDIGLPEGTRVFSLWQDWLKEQIKGKKI